MSRLLRIVLAPGTRHQDQTRDAQPAWLYKDQQFIPWPHTRHLPKVGCSEGGTRAAGSGVSACWLKGLQVWAPAGVSLAESGRGGQEHPNGSDKTEVDTADASWGLLVDEPSFFELEVEELLQGTGAAAIFTVWGIVLPAVGYDPLQVSYKEFPGHIVATAQPFCHGLQVWVTREKARDFKR